MFSAPAELYDLIYSGFKDYPAESGQLAATIRRAHPQALLVDQHGFDVDGLDLDPAFVAIARRKLRRGTVYEVT